MNRVSTPLTILALALFAGSAAWADKQTPAVTSIMEAVEKLTPDERVELRTAIEARYPAKPEVSVVEPAPTWDCMLTNYGDTKLQVVKAVGIVNDVGLSEAKTLVDGTPCTVQSQVSQAQAEACAQALVAAGATASATASSD